MIDIHSHILPGIDDGSQSVEESHALLALLREQGVETVVATPHFYADRNDPENFLRRRKEALTQLDHGETEMPRILLGAEVAYFDGMSHSAELLDLQLGTSGLLLVEMPFAAWTQRMIAEVCQLQLLTGLTPVLAHVERYRRADRLPKFKRQLLEQGVLFQCNAEAFLSMRDRRWALSLLKKGDIHFLGSDAHNLTTRPPQLAQAAAVITQKLGADAFARLAALNKEQLNL